MIQLPKSVALIATDFGSLTRGATARRSRIPRQSEKGYAGLRDLGILGQEQQDIEHRQGKLAGGLKLKDEGGRRMTRNGDGVRVVDGPFAEAKEVVGGFFLIEAADYDEAVEISRSCPHLVYGQSIELREVDPIHD